MSKDKHSVSVAQIVGTWKVPETHGNSDRTFQVGGGTCGGKEAAREGLHASRFPRGLAVTGRRSGGFRFSRANSCFLASDGPGLGSGGSSHIVEPRSSRRPQYGCVAAVTGGCESSGERRRRAEGEADLTRRKSNNSTVPEGLPGHVIKCMGNPKYIKLAELIPSSNRLGFQCNNSTTIGSINEAGDNVVAGERHIWVPWGRWLEAGNNVFYSQMYGQSSYRVFSDKLARNILEPSWQVLSQSLDGVVPLDTTKLALRLINERQRDPN